MSIRQIRKQRGLTQAKLSELAGVRRETIARAECGKTQPDTGTLRKLAHALDVTVDDLLREKDTA